MFRHKLLRDRRIVFSVCLLGVIFAAAYGVEPKRRELKRLRVETLPQGLPADGFTTVPIRAYAPDGAIVPVTARVVQGQRVLRAEDGRLLTTVLPGTASFDVSAPGFRTVRQSIETHATAADRLGDGTPDYLRLHTLRDREAFRLRYAAIAELQAVRPSRSLPPEISDCSGLVRYAYREAFREDANVAISPPQKWRFPYTPLGASLFRIAGGEYEERDIAQGRFAEFADAETLLRHNLHRVSRDVQTALPADLLFYRQPGQRMPFHAMVVLPRTSREPSGAVVYHTGPIGAHPGEVRRPSLTELLAHPQPQWRPVAGNPNFLGVYRWNNLKEDQP